MKIGLSLPVEYLAGVTDTAAYSRYRTAFGEIDRYLDHVKNKGVNSIELRGTNFNVDPNIVAAAVRRVISYDMEWTVHCYLPEHTDKRSFYGLYPQLADMLEAPGHYAETIITVHAHTAADGETTKLAAETTHALRHIVKVLAEERLPLKFALELNRQKRAADPGTTYSSLLNILDTVGDERLGFCWDVGHAYANEVRGLLEHVPPRKFLEHIIHTHIHDIGPDGKTHWPLTQRVIPLEDYIKLLVANGYDGVLNMEFTLERFCHQGTGCNPAKQVDESIDIVRGLLSNSVEE